MKKFLKAIIVFLLLFFIVDKVSYLILLKTASLQSENKLERIVNGHMDYDLLVIGSSRGIGNISTKQLQAETCITSYNLSFRAADLLFQEYILKLYLEHNTTPKKLLLSIDSPTMFSVGGSFKFRFDRLYPFAYSDIINDKLIAMGKHSSLSQYLYTLRLHNSQLKFNKVETNFGLETDANGAQLLDGQAPSFAAFQNGEPSLSYMATESLEKIQALESIIALCTAEKIELIFVFPPNYIPFNTGFYERLDHQFGKENRIFIYDRTNAIYEDKPIYYDPIHLNREGAKIFTSEISDYINAQ